MTLSLQKFIKEDVPLLPNETPNNERFLVTEAWKHSDCLCKNYILSGLEDDLYNIYSNMETSKELWIGLEKKYKTEDVGLKKFVAAKFLDYKMVDTKSVITQVQELIFIERLVSNEAFQVAAMIEKLPHLWKDFKNYFKHKKQGDVARRSHCSDAPQNNRNRKKPSGPKSNPSKNRFKGNCYKFGKAGHKSADCRTPRKDKKKGQANMVEKHEDIGDLCVMLSECNLVVNPKE
ncbi:uncharacterized protein [Nicotiana tomentosiformis]|uniref:uncharacterized protein n=1 Tax=Nicotiana tomentosiformis TaxID=4098 RepID=UPI00388C7D65